MTKTSTSPAPVEDLDEGSLLTGTVVTLDIRWRRILARSFGGRGGSFVFLGAIATACANGSGTLVYEGLDPLGPYRHELSAGNCFTTLKGRKLEGIWHVGYGRLAFDAEPGDGATPSFDSHLSTWKLRITEAFVNDGGKQWSVSSDSCDVLRP